MSFAIRLRNKFSLELVRCKKIIKDHHVWCACLLLTKKILTSPITLFIALCIVIIRPLFKIYLIRLNSSRMGHFALGTELMLARFAVNPDKINGKILLFYLRLTAANSQLLKMCKRSFYILPFPRLCANVDLWLRRILGEKYENDFVKSFELNSALIDHEGLFKRTGPHLSFTQKELNDGKYLLQQLGVSSEAKFICLLVRDHGYISKEFPGEDYSHHTIRNADVYTYKKAALYLADKGYFILRMGKHVEQSFEVSHSRVIDYSNHPLRSDFMDIYLAAHCYFFISTGSGLDSVACMFRRPKLITNVVLPRDLPTWYPGVFFIFKKIWDNKNRKYLTLKNMMELGMIDPNVGISHHILNQYYLEVVHNTEDEILDAVRDIESHLDGTLRESEQYQVAQKKFNQIFPKICDDQKIFIRISPSYYENGFVVLE